MADRLQTQPPSSPSYRLSYPAPYVLLMTIDRASRMNSIPYDAHWEADAILSWFDAEPSLRVAVVTGAGDKSFCAGQDLIELGKLRGAGAGDGSGGGEQRPRQMTVHPPSGFMGISRRNGKKPIIAAVNGYAYGGGFEVCLGCDMVVAAPRAKFALPEASRGVYAAAGGLPRLVRLCGIALASEIAMAGRILSAEEAARLLVINRVSQTDGSVVAEAVELAGKIAGLSPDAIITTRHGLRQALETASVERATQLTHELYGVKLPLTENTRIGLDAFAQKKQPRWVPSKL